MERPFSRISSRYDLLNDIMSLGLHRRWKNRLVGAVLARRPEGVIVDIATGTGEVADRLARARGGPAGVIGVDPCAEMLDEGKRKGRRAESWVTAPSENLPLADASAGAITCAFGVRNFSDRGVAFAEWRRVLATGGVAGIVEIHPIPESGLLRPPLAFYWRRVVPSLGALFGMADAYTYLRDSAAGFITQQGLLGELSAAGFAPLASASLFGRGMVSLTLVEKR